MLLFEWFSYNYEKMHYDTIRKQLLEKCVSLLNLECFSFLKIVVDEIVHENKWNINTSNDLFELSIQNDELGGISVVEDT